jgi:hypothetical protein
MAKVKGPLFSLDARGKIADTLVYMGWKGLKTVRQYVIPSNPNTANQQTQRGYFSDAVDAWQEANFLSIDITAWNLLAQARKAVASGFNMFMKSFVDAKVNGDDFTVLTNVAISAIGSDTATVTVPISEDKDTKIYYGTSITNMSESDDLAFSVDETEVVLSSLSPNTTYFFYLINEAEGEAGRTGIYTFTTSAS